MIRVVLDTNVIVSAILHRGIVSKIYGLWKEEKIKPLVSRSIIEEYYRVLSYPKFHLSEEDIRYLVEEEVLFYAEPVMVTHVDKVIKADPSDDQFLACAIQGRAQFIISGDKHLLDLKEYKAVPIVTVREFLTQHSASAT